MHTVVIVIHLMVVVTMIGFVLLQRSEGGGLGTGSGGGFLTSRGTSNVLTRTTALLAAGFFVTSLVLSVIAGLGRKPTSVIQGTQAPTEQQQGAPSVPGSPITPGSGGLLDQPGGQPAQPPAAPGGPQIPQSR